MMVPLCLVDHFAENVEIIRQHGDDVLRRVLLADGGEVVDVGEQRRDLRRQAARPPKWPASMPLRTSSRGT